MRFDMRNGNGHLMIPETGALRELVVSNNTSSLDTPIEKVF